MAGKKPSMTLSSLGSSSMKYFLSSSFISDLKISSGLRFLSFSIGFRSVSTHFCGCGVGVVWWCGLLSCSSSLLVCGVECFSKSI